MSVPVQEDEVFLNSPSVNKLFSFNILGGIIQF